MVWIPPGELRDKRELPRTRMVFGAARTRLKNRIHSALAKYGLQDFTEVTDIFGKRGREDFRRVMGQLPLQTRFALRGLLQKLDAVGRHLAEATYGMLRGQEIYKERVEKAVSSTSV